MTDSYRSQFFDLLSKSMDLVLYDRDLRYERVKYHEFSKLLRVIQLVIERSFVVMQTNAWNQTIDFTISIAMILK